MMKSHKEPKAIEDGDSVVRVRAQVMMRDDSTGGWVPVGGGGLSNVSVQKQKIFHEDEDQLCKHEYLIDGKRISDQAMVLNCTIKRDFEYNRVMPTFHHWRTDNKKFGLTFQTAADARAFDKGVRMAIWDLLDGASATSPLHLSQFDLGDEEVFMTLDLPMGNKGANPNRTTVTVVDSISGTNNTSTITAVNSESKVITTAVSNYHHGHSPPLDDRNGVGYRLHNRHVPVTSSKSASPPSAKTSTKSQSAMITTTKKYSGIVSSQPSALHKVTSNDSSNSTDKDYSYVKFPRRSELPHDYSYPLLPEGYNNRRTSGSANNTTGGSGGNVVTYDPPSWPPMKPPRESSAMTYSTGTPLKKGAGTAADSSYNSSSSNSNNSSKKSSRRSLPSLVLSCAGGSTVEEEDETQYTGANSTSVSGGGGPAGGLLNAVEMGSTTTSPHHRGRSSPRSALPPPPAGMQADPSLAGPLNGSSGSAAIVAAVTNSSSANNTYTTLTCLHCRKSFKPSANRKGDCHMAPNDKARSFVEHASCIQCANCFVYHCMSDSEGDTYGGHPCDCTSGGGGGSALILQGGHSTASLWKRWLGLSLLAVFVPCLCCYPPLMACYRCGAACNLCGGKHYSPKNEPAF